MNDVPEHTEAQDDKDFCEWMGEGQPEEEYDDSRTVEEDQELRAKGVYRAKYPSGDFE